MNGPLIRIVLICIAAFTVIAGLVQLVAPAWELRIIATSQSALAAQFFATVGMFMIITGAMFLQSLLMHSTEGTIPLWIGVQKGAAAVLVSGAIMRGLLVPIAYVTAGFDAISAIITLVFWWRLPR